MKREHVMKNIGERIKEYRLLNNMTQDQLATYLHVTFQTVSKWETGKSSPDLSLIPPITKLFRISADELLGISNDESSKKHNELTKAYINAVEMKNYAERLRICELALGEFPGDMMWLFRLAFSIAPHDVEYEENHQDYQDEIEKSIKILDSIIKNSKDEITKVLALQRIIQLFAYINRKDMGKKYAEMIPVRPQVTKNTVMKYILEGDELIVYKQDQLLTHVTRIFGELHDRPTAYTELYRFIAEIMFPDGNYLGINGGLYDAAKRELNHIIQHDNNVSPKKIIELLTDMKQYAEAYDEIAFTKPDVYKFTVPWFDHLEQNTREWQNAQGNSPLTQDFYEYLNEPQFDNIRNMIV